MTIINVDFVSITNRDVARLSKLASAEERVFCQCRYHIDSASRLTDGVMEFGYGRARGGMPVGKRKNFGRALVGWDERITNFTGIGGACSVPCCQGDGSIEHSFFELLLGEWLAWWAGPLDGFTYS